MASRHKCCLNALAGTNLNAIPTARFTIDKAMEALGRQCRLRQPIGSILAREAFVRNGFPNLIGGASIPFSSGFAWGRYRRNQQPGPDAAAYRERPSGKAGNRSTETTSW